MCYAEKEEYGEVMVEVISNDNKETKMTLLTIVPTFREKDLQRSKQVLKQKLALAIEKRISV